MCISTAPLREMMLPGILTTIAADYFQLVYADNNRNEVIWLELLLGGIPTGGAWDNAKKMKLEY
jgi:Na+/H+-translocating membrane pyrophosphatase